MCYYLALAVPEAQVDQLPLSLAPQFVIEPLKNRSIMTLLPAGYVPFTLSRGDCGCSIYTTPKAEDEQQKEIEAQRSKYEKRGWSDAKIARALQTSRVVTKPEALGGLAPEVASMLQEVCARTGTLAIFPFECLGSLEYEQIALKQMVRCHNTDLPVAGSRLELNSLLLVSERVSQ